MNLQALQRIYFLGIGGIGMSALARYFHQRGLQVSGYDKSSTPLTRQLTAEGIDVHYDTDLHQLPDQVDMVIFTPAVPSDHPGFDHFRKLGVPFHKRAEVLGMISQHARCIAVAGTHGKTTTSTIMAHVLRKAGVDCSAFLGGISGNYGTNYLLGHDDWMVVEADEYDRSFLHLHPTVLIINALDPDHLDIYRDEEDMRNTYYQLIRQVKPGGIVLLKEGLEIPDAVLSEIRGECYVFGQGSTDIRLSDIHQSDEHLVFDLETPQGSFPHIEFTLPGRHNAMNAAASFAAGLLIGLEASRIREGLSSFLGVRRRFDIHVNTDTAVYVDDYAHHPVELAGLIQAMRSRFPGQEITGIFQPHLFSRTRDFADEFARVLDQFDIPLITEIYPAREAPIPGVNSQMLLDRMTNPRRQLLPKADLLDYVIANKPGVLVTAGAGDIDQYISDIISILNPSRT
ncbi:MAG: UDP-N-acetylmuramate--L-alanine ligase [Saprospiraceae bacterium]